MLLFRLKMTLFNLLIFVLLIFIAVSESRTVSDDTNRSIQQRIVGGETTLIENYPFAALILTIIDNDSYLIECGGSILTSRTVLSAAHCFYNSNSGSSLLNYKIRVGSSFAYSGGELHSVNAIIIHDAYDHSTFQNDIAILQVPTRFTFSNLVAPVGIPSAFYNLPDNDTVTAIGWGAIYYNGPRSEELRKVDINIVNQDVCSSRYFGSVTDEMLCAGILDVGGKDACTGDSGGPLIHNGIVVGVISWGSGCASAQYPGISARISVLSRWIINTLSNLR